MLECVSLTLHVLVYRILYCVLQEVNNFHFDIERMEIEEYENGM